MRHFLTIGLAVSMFLGQFGGAAVAFASEPPQVQTGCVFLPTIRGQQSQSFNGNGSEVLTVYLSAGTISAKGTSCKGKFVVEVYSVQGDRVGMPIDCDGVCSDKQGTIRIHSNGTYLVNITAQTSWSLSLF